MGRGITSLNHVTAQGETQQRVGEPIHQTIRRQEGIGAGIKRPATRLRGSEGHPSAPRYERSQPVEEEPPKRQATRVTAPDVEMVEAPREPPPQPVPPPVQAPVPQMLPPPVPPVVAEPKQPGTDKLLLVAAVLLGVSVTVSIYDLFL